MTPRRPDSGTTDVRAAILGAATALFKERGVDGLSMRQIANEIGYSATTIYLHFEDKDALMLAVCSAGFEEFGATLEAAARSAASPLDGIRASGDAYVRFALNNPMLYDVMFLRPKEWALPAPGDPDSLHAFAMLVGAAMSAGQLRQGDPREAAALLWSGMHGVASSTLVFQGQINGLEPDAAVARARAVTDALLASLT
ncbi:TetR/AcrR family transcriptional regulator [Demequina sp.]|uniref:TetR/AcrR family transcriptional regulator n=1 Tax=Demequina sp. TaxID=2050685 RepID=UPI003D12D7B7